MLLSALLLLCMLSWRPGAASLLWVECALQSLSTDLRSRYGPGASLVFKHGPYLQALSAVGAALGFLPSAAFGGGQRFSSPTLCARRHQPLTAAAWLSYPHAVSSCLQVAAAIGAGAVFYNSRYEPAMCDTDARVASGLSAAGISVHPSAGLLLQEPWDVKVGGVQGTCMRCMQVYSCKPRIPQCHHAAGPLRFTRQQNAEHPQVQGLWCVAMCVDACCPAACSTHAAQPVQVARPLWHLDAFLSGLVNTASTRQALARAAAAASGQGQPCATVSPAASSACACPAARQSWSRLAACLPGRLQGSCQVEPSQSPCVRVCVATT